MTRISKTKHYVGDVEYGVPIIRGMTPEKMKFRDNVSKMDVGGSFLTTISGSLKIARAIRPNGKFTLTRENGQLRLHLLEEENG